MHLVMVDGTGKNLLLFLENLDTKYIHLHLQDWEREVDLVSKNVNLNTDIENALNTKISNPLYLPKIRLEVRPFDGCKL